MEAFIGSALLAMIGGLTWLAYQHPKEFNSLSRVLGWLAAIVMIAIAIWNMAIDQAALTVVKNDPVGSVSLVKKINTGKIYNANAFAIFIGVAAYMMFLSVFVTVLKKRGQDGLDKNKYDE